MSATVYKDYSRDRIGWFFGITTVPLILLALATLPVLWAISHGAWTSTLLLAGLWVLLLVVTVVPVHGRPATGWLIASISYALGGLLGWTSFRAQAAEGRLENLETPDLPGVLQTVQVHDGPPNGPNLQRVAIIQDHATRSWAVTASIVHPGIGMEPNASRDRYGQALKGLLDLAAQTEKIDEVHLMVRTVPEDGAERELWVSNHHRPEAPPLADQINNDLANGLSQASVRTEQFVTFVVPESRIARAAKEAGGGLEGRCRELYGLLNLIGAQLRGPMGASSVNWLTSPELAAACRTGFAPGDRAGIVAALAAREKNPNVNADVPWGMAGPSGADPAVRHYSHDAWNSVSSTIKLPPKGVVMGALANILTPSQPGERRSFTVCYPIVAQGKAEREAGNRELAADAAEAINHKLGRRARAKERENAAKARGMDTKLAGGNAAIRPYAVCTVTAPKTARISEYGRALDSSIRFSGFAPLRLDVAQDTGFVVSCIPMGVSLTRRGDL